MSASVFDLILISIGLGALAWRSIVAIRVGCDARRHGLSISKSMGWAFVAVVNDQLYWWGTRLNLLSAEEAQDLLRATAQAHRLKSVVNIRCPLCDAEIENALAVSTDGLLFIRRQATCPQCDFRVDACRHCLHFRPAAEGAAWFDRHGDFGHGRCGYYRAAESVRTAYPQHARRMEALGYDMLPTPKPIVDSYIPLEECTAFTLAQERLRANGVPWINHQRVALIRLHQRSVRTFTHFA